jgi:hypothetical protein
MDSNELVQKKKPRVRKHWRFDLYESIDVLTIQPLCGFWRPHGDACLSAVVR